MHSSSNGDYEENIIHRFLAMEIEKNYPNSWSELPHDLLNSVFERLGFADFQRGKCVCSSWYSASRQCVPKNQVPWLILFPKHKSNINSCTLFNPEEKDKLYRTQDLGCDFSESKCRATYGSWLLMQDPLDNLYVLNLFTHERIDLPSIESQLGMIKIERISDDMFLISNHHTHRPMRGSFYLRCPVFWIDEKTKDYIVIWGLRNWCLLYTKKGDDLWKQIPQITDYFDLVYKDHKLYYSCFENSFGVFDFSGEVPQQTFCGVLPLNVPRRDPHEHDRVVIKFTKLVVTPTGDVLKVVRWLSRRTGVSSFSVFKVYSSGSLMYERVYSLGNEAMLFDLGITVLANDIEELKKNSIYFNIGPHVRNPTEICLFNLQTRKMEPLHKFDCPSLQLSTARWFLPSFMRKCLV